MILAPTNNITASSLGYLTGAQNSTVLKSTSISSSDLASSSQLPSVNVSLSSSSGLAASTVAGIPPIYSKPTVAAMNESQLSPSRPNASSEGLAEDAILSGSQVSEETEEDNSLNAKSQGGEEGKEGEESKSSGLTLSEDEFKMIEDLKMRDREVKAHEQAHKSVGGQYTGAISYSYQAGPDGKRYAVGGEVPIDVSPVSGDPQATMTKMTIVRAAATAPAEPSAQDQSVAAQAAMLLAEAQSELGKSKSEVEKQTSSRQADKETERRQTFVSENSIDVFVTISQDGVSSNNLIDASV
tara:strand:- start:11460 stop:12353 length:894 start_codon:yes stop_codon:yes gene_type:complete